MTKRICAPRTEWTPAMIETMTQRYPNESSLVLAKHFGIAIQRVYQKAARMKLTKTAAFLASQESGRTDGKRGGASRFQAGHKPWNKGTHFVAGGRSAETRFKKGNRTHTWNPIGFERVTKDGLLQRKMTEHFHSPRDYVSVHLIIYQEHHKTIVQRGHVVIFEDGNKRNFDISNLKMVSRAELMKRNSVHNLPKELAELVQLRGAVNRQINARSKQS